MAARGAGAAGMLAIGYLSARSPEDTQHLLAAFRNGLAQSGYVEGQNVSIEYRWALGQYDRLPALAEELVVGAPRPECLCTSRTDQMMAIR